MPMRLMPLPALLGEAQAAWRAIFYRSAWVAYRKSLATIQSALIVHAHRRRLKKQLRAVRAAELESEFRKATARLVAARQEAELRRSEQQRLELLWADAVSEDSIRAVR